MAAYAYVFLSNLLEVSGLGKRGKKGTGKWRFQSVTVTASAFVTTSGASPARARLIRHRQGIVLYCVQFLFAIGQALNHLCLLQRY